MPKILVLAMEMFVAYEIEVIDNKGFIYVFCQLQLVRTEQTNSMINQIM